MRITFIKENRDAGTESISTCDTAAFITRIKSETKPGHVSALRTMLEYTSHGSGGTYGHIDKLPRICPATEYEGVSKCTPSLFYVQSPDFHKLGLCYYLKILYL